MLNHPRPNDPHWASLDHKLAECLGWTVDPQAPGSVEVATTQYAQAGVYVLAWRPTLSHDQFHTILADIKRRGLITRYWKRLSRIVWPERGHFRLDDTDVEKLLMATPEQKCAAALQTYESAL